jgi:hypothetical protein
LKPLALPVAVQVHPEEVRACKAISASTLVMCCEYSLVDKEQASEDLLPAAAAVEPLSLNSTQPENIPCLMART